MSGNPTCTPREVNTNFHEFFKNCDIDVSSSCEGTFCLFLFLFFPHLQVFLWSYAFPNCHSARPFLFLLSFLSSEAIFLFFSFHHIQHLIYHIRESSNLFKSITAMRKTCKKSLIICKFHDYFLILQPMKRVRPKKNFGQHFIIDLNIAKAIADTVDACPDCPSWRW